MINGGMNVFEFQNMYPIKPLREKALRGMTNDEIDEIIASCGTAQGKAYYVLSKNKDPFAYIAVQPLRLIIHPI